MAGKLRRGGLAAMIVAVVSTAALVGALPGSAAGAVDQAAPAPDLRVSRWTLPSQVDVGSDFTLGIDIVNSGGPATNGQLVLDVGPGIEVVSTSIGWFGRSCSVVGSTATCSIGTVDPSQFVSFGLHAAAEGPVDIGVVLSSDEADADPSDNSPSGSVYVRGPSAIDLRLTGSPMPATLAPTEQLDYALTVTNLFNFPTSGVRVTSTVPDAFEIRSTAIGLFRTCSVSGQVVTCDVGALGVRASVDIAIVLVARDLPGQVQLSAEVTSSLPDPFPDDDVTTSTVTIEGVAQPPDLVVALQLPATAYTGATVNGKVQVANLGGQVSGVVVELEVPAGMGLVSATTGLNPHSCAISGTTVTCALGTSTTFWFADLVFAPADGTHEVVATVRADQTDADLSSNETSRTIAVGGIAPIPFQVTSQVSRDFVRPGDAVTQRIDVVNRSQVPASAVVVGTTVPSAFEIRSARIGWFARPCTVVGQDVSCTVGDLAAGTSRFILLDLVVADDASSGSFQLAARIVSSTPGAVTSGSVATSTVTVDASGALPDLAILRSLPASTTVGTPVDLRISAVQGSGGPPTGVVATVQLPDGLEAVSSSIGWFGRPCSVAGSTVTCSFASSSTTWFATIVVQPTSPGTHDVVVEVHTDQEDANPADNSSTVSTTTT
ncbi:MAG: DUF11 domain-containing protein [Actinobacteria bacterium]|nr:DUF11 domain-containing protein [Actinomycetota bacterium]